MDNKKFEWCFGVNLQDTVFPVCNDFHTLILSPDFTLNTRCLHDFCSCMSSKYFKFILKKIKILINYCPFPTMNLTHCTYGKFILPSVLGRCFGIILISSFSFTPPLSQQQILESLPPNYFQNVITSQKFHRDHLYILVDNAIAP